LSKDETYGRGLAYRRGLDHLV